MEKHDKHFTPGQVDQQIEHFSRRAIDTQDVATGDEANARLLLGLRQAYRQQASAHHDGLGRVLDRLLQYEAQSARRARASTSLSSAHERKSDMEHPISGSTPRHPLAQRLGLLAAAALLVLLVGSMAVVINLAHQSKESTGKQATTKTASTTIAQSNLYVAFDRTIEKLDSKTGKVLWTFSAPGGVYTPVTIAQGVVYIVPQDSAIIALNATSGKQLWQTSQHFNGSVVVVQNIIYAINSDSDALTALDASNGHILWQRQPAPISRIVAADGIIYGTATIESASVPAYAVLNAFNASDGTELWHKTFSGQSLVNTPQIVDGMLYTVSTVDNKGANPPDRHSYVYAFDAQNGDLRWRSSEIKAYVSIAPTVTNGTVYVGSNALGTAGPAVYAFRASDGSLAWEKAATSSVDTCMLVGNGAVYVAEATSFSNVTEPVLALDASNGSLRWSHQLAYYYGFGEQDCALSGGLLYILTDDGLIHVLQATDGAQVGSYNAGNAGFPALPRTLVMAP